MVWDFHNPVRIRFGAGALTQLPTLVKGRAYCLVTYNDAVFQELAARIAALVGEPALMVNDVRPNPDFTDLERACRRWQQSAQVPEVIVAVGGGSAMDAAKVLAAAKGDFRRVRRYLELGEGEADLGAVPVVAVPTTAGTGSEVTCWATVWHAEAQKKYSLALPSLYPEWALVDPELTLPLPRALTISTALDALSHALESLWNINRNPVSTRFAVTAARDIVNHLPALVADPDNLSLRSQVARAALMAGLAFSNTKTAIAHNISYPVTLRYGVPHGEACSFTLPAILASVIGQSPELDASLREVFGSDLNAGVQCLETFFRELGISTSFSDYGISDSDWRGIVDAAFAGERGANFIGDRERFLHRMPG